MNRIFIISLLAIMLLQTFSKVLLIIDYQANKEYIIEFLCINRDKPELECEGKCHLTKELQKQDQAEKHGGRMLAQEVQLTLFYQQFFSFEPIKRAATQAPQSLYMAGHTRQAYHSIFHPPQSIVS